MALGPQTRTVMPRGGPRVVFFPTFAHFDDAAHGWRLRIHGWIFEPVHESVIRRLLVHLMPRMFGVHTDAEQSDRLRRRVWPFIAGGTQSQQIEVEIGGVLH